MPRLRLSEGVSRITGNTAPATGRLIVMTYRDGSIRWQRVDVATEFMDDLVIGPKTELPSTPVVRNGDASRAAASFNTGLLESTKHVP